MKSRRILKWSKRDGLLIDKGLIVPLKCAKLLYLMLLEEALNLARLRQRDGIFTTARYGESY